MLTPEICENEGMNPAWEPVLKQGYESNSPDWFSKDPMSKQIAWSFRSQLKALQEDHKIYVGIHMAIDRGYFSSVKYFLIPKPHKKKCQSNLPVTIMCGVMLGMKNLQLGLTQYKPCLGLPQ